MADNIYTNIPMYVSMEKYDEKVSPVLEKMRRDYLRNEGKYNFAIKTIDNEVIGVLPTNIEENNKLGFVTIVFEQGNGIGKMKLDNLLRRNLN